MRTRSVTCAEQRRPRCAGALPARSRPTACAIDAPDQDEAYRRPIRYRNERSDALEIQVVDVQCRYCYRPDADLWSERSAVVYYGPTHVFDVYGVDREGASARIEVHGFRPYLYLRTGADPATVRKRLDDVLRQKFGGGCRGGGGGGERRGTGLFAARRMYVVRVARERCRSIVGYDEGDGDDFLRIELADQGYVPSARLAALDGRATGEPCDPFECNLDFVKRFIVDTQIAGGGWARVQAKRWRAGSAGRHGAATSCSYEARCAWEDLEPLPDAEDPRESALRVVSFDIECAGDGKRLPVPEEHRCITICADLSTVGGREEDVRSVVWQLGSVARPDDRQNDVAREVRVFGRGLPLTAETGARMLDAAELEMIRDWADWVRDAADPDVVTGHNICGYDLPWLLGRVDALDADCRAGLELGRRLGDRAQAKARTFQSKACGTEKTKEVRLSGRAVVDALQVLRRTVKLRSYTLNHVAELYLKERKEDVHHTTITPLWLGSPADRWRLASYCAQDARLSRRILENRKIVEDIVAQCRVTHILPEWLHTQGQQARVFTLLHIYALHKPEGTRLLVPMRQDTDGAAAEGKYKGATVIEPKRGYYEDIVVTLDFAGLYPSIMRAHNLSYDTLLTDAQAAAMPSSDDWERAPNGVAFVRRHVRHGILPRMLEDILNARSSTNEKKKSAIADGDGLMASLYNILQLALKMTACSVYGATGSAQSKIPLIEIGSAVTGYGREMLQLTVDTVMELEPERAEIIYGDTDSVMILLKDVETLEEAHDIGDRLAAEVTKRFTPPIKLEFEKAFKVSVFINKKRYAAWACYWEPKRDPETGEVKLVTIERLLSKGLESTRRDNCPLLSDTVKSIIELVTKERDVEGACKMVRDAVTALRRQEVSLDRLTISKAYTKGKEDYASVQTHITLAERMTAREPATAPQIGDRVPYVIRPGAKHQRIHQRSEDPLYMIEHDLPYDSEYYIDNQLREPIKRVLEPVIGKKGVSDLFVGDHARRKRRRVGGSTGPGDIAAFCAAGERCRCCRSPVGSDAHRGAVVCATCRETPAHQRLVEENRAALVDIEDAHAAALAKCAECRKATGTAAEDACSTRECPVLYQRAALRKRCAEHRRVVDDEGGPAGDRATGQPQESEPEPEPAPVERQNRRIGQRRTRKALQPPTAKVSEKRVLDDPVDIRSFFRPDKRER